MWPRSSLSAAIFMYSPGKMRQQDYRFFPRQEAQAALSLPHTEHHLSYKPDFSETMGLYFAFGSGIPCTKFGMPKPATGADPLPPRRQQGPNAQAE